MDEPEIFRLLKNAFSKEEWQYLQGHSSFQTLLKENNRTHEDFEFMVDVGELLLRQKKDLNLE